MNPVFWLFMGEIKIKKIKRALKKRLKKFCLISLNEESLKRKMLILCGIFLASFVLNIQAAEKNTNQSDFFFSNSLPPQRAQLEKEIKKMVAGYPIERMTTYIAAQDRQVAAYLVSIAKKESNWGKRAPVLAGKDCFNYWGFRLKTEAMGSGGHTCFENPRQAVKTVSRRIAQLVEEEKIDTPREMVVWKCGYRCDGPERFGADKWISDVSFYYNRLAEND